MGRAQQLAQPFTHAHGTVQIERKPPDQICVATEAIVLARVEHPNGTDNKPAERAAIQHEPGDCAAPGDARVALLGQRAQVRATAWGLEAPQPRGKDSEQSRACLHSLPEVEIGTLFIPARPEHT